LLLAAVSLLANTSDLRLKLLRLLVV
jgi:hypothetical protein